MRDGRETRHRPQTCGRWSLRQTNHPERDHQHVDCKYLRVETRRRGGPKHEPPALNGGAGGEPARRSESRNPPGHASNGGPGGFGSARYPMTAAIALAILEAIGPARRAHAGAEVRARLYAAQVELAATPVRIDPYLVVALIERESGWHEGAIGAKGELGLGQLLPHSDAIRGYERHPSAVLKAPINIRLTVAWMAHKRAACRTADPVTWLSAYKGLRCGPSRYSRWIVARAGELRELALGLAEGG